MIRACLAAAALLGTCSKESAAPLPPLPKDLAPVLDVDAGPALVAAVGDISDSAFTTQQAMSDLVLDGGYDAVLLLGDVQYPAGALTDFQTYFAPTWGRLMPSLRPVPGNHEYRTKGEGYFTYFGSRAGEKGRGWYSFDLGAWHLIALNTNNACRTQRCDATSEQLDWLRKDLTAHRNRCTLAYFHHPRFSSGEHHGSFEGSQAIWATLAQYGADVVLNGHEHFYERFEPIDGMREFIVGTGGMSHYGFESNPHPQSAVRDEKSFGVLRLELLPSSYRWRFVPLPPATFSDEGSSRCR